MAKSRRSECRSYRSTLPTAGSIILSRFSQTLNDFSGASCKREDGVDRDRKFAYQWATWRGSVVVPA
jgi:hypothetical protein